MTATTLPKPQASLDRFCETTADARSRGELTVGALADADPLMALPPVPYPATVEQTGPVDVNATIAFRATRYSVPPGFIGATLTVRHRLGSPTIEIVSSSGALVATHRLGVAGSFAHPSIGPRLSVPCAVSSPACRPASARATIHQERPHDLRLPPCGHPRTARSWSISPAMPS